MSTRQPKFVPLSELPIGAAFVGPDAKTSLRSDFGAVYIKKEGTYHDMSNTCRACRIDFIGSKDRNVHSSADVYYYKDLLVRRVFVTNSQYNKLFVGDVIAIRPNEHIKPANGTVYIVEGFQGLNIHLRAMDHTPEFGILSESRVADNQLIILRSYVHEHCFSEGPTYNAPSSPGAQQKEAPKTDAIKNNTNDIQAELLSITERVDALTVELHDTKTENAKLIAALTQNHIDLETSLSASKDYIFVKLSDLESRYNKEIDYTRKALENDTVRIDNVRDITTKLEKSLDYITRSDDSHKKRLNGHIGYISDLLNRIAVLELESKNKKLASLKPSFWRRVFG